MPTTSTLPVKGMSCSGCENAVTRAVGGLAGVTQVRASHTAAQVVVTYDPSLVSLGDITAKIGRLGYAVEVG